MCSVDAVVCNPCSAPKWQGLCKTPPVGTVRSSDRVSSNMSRTISLKRLPDGGQTTDGPQGSSVTLTEVRPEATKSIPCSKFSSGSRWVTISSIGNNPCSSMRMAVG